MAELKFPIEFDHEYLEKLVHEITVPATVAVLKTLRLDLLDKLSEEKSTYHISDVGVGLERAIVTVDEYIGRMEKDA